MRRRYCEYDLWVIKCSKCFTMTIAYYVFLILIKFDVYAKS